MRLIRVLVLIAALAAIVVPGAGALRFADTPCVEAGGGGIRVCPVGLVGALYAIKLDGDGGCGPDPNVPGSGLPYQFRLLNGTLPPGLALRKDGLLSGVPTEAGSWSFWVELSDQDPPSASWCAPKKSEREFSVQVGPQAVVGRPYSLVLGAASVGPETWSISSGTLPAGLTLSSDGQITGTPEVAGSFPFELSVVDSTGRTSVLDLTIVVSPTLTLVTTRLPLGSVGRPYRALVRTSGGVGPLRLRVVSGRFPTGVRLNVATGRFSGRSRKAGIYRFTIEVTDALGDAARRTFVLTVRHSHA
jgi:large repetitive protein